MARFGLQKGEGLGLAVALALHAGVLVVLIVRPGAKDVVPKPQRIEVSISDDVGLTSTSPDPDSKAAPDYATMLGDKAPAAETAPEAPEEPAPAPEPVAKPEPKPAPKPEPKPKPAPKAKPKPKPRPAPPKEKAAPKHHESAIDDIVSKPSAHHAPTPSKSRAKEEPKKAGGSRVGANFLDGITGASDAEGSGTPASQVGPSTRSALSAAITRQLKPHWNPPSGVDVDKLVTVLSFDLNKDGSLAGKPRVVRQRGITASNRAQAARHAEQAIRAVELASPFNLPAEYYNAWKHVSSFEFDLRLSQ